MNEEVEYFSSKVDWWVYAVVVFTIACCMLGPMLSHSDYLLGALFGVATAAIEVVIFASVKYAIRGRELGVRMFYRWHWYPIDKITEVRKVTGILSAAALSVRRVGIRFSDRSIMKSFGLLELSPLRRNEFIARLRAINPDIKIGPKI